MYGCSSDRIETDVLEFLYTQGNSRYPVRSSTGFGKEQNSEFIIHSPFGNWQKLHKSETIILQSCNGSKNVNELIQELGKDYPEYFGRFSDSHVYRALVALANSSLIEFAAFDTEPIPLVTVQFGGFWTDFRPEMNFFTKMMAKRMFVIATDNGTPDITFHSDCYSISDTYTPSRNESVQVFVSGRGTKPDFDTFDFAFSPGAVSEEHASHHCQIPYEIYAGSSPFCVDLSVAKKFYEFLYPVKASDFRFDFSNKTKEFASTAKKKRNDNGNDDRKTNQDLGLENDNLFHVFFSTDRQQSNGLFALINSILRNTRAPESFFFHILVENQRSYYEHILDTRFSDTIKFDVVEFKNTIHYNRFVEFLEAKIRVSRGAKEPSRIANLMNYARFYLPEIFPEVNFGLYLDVDMIVQTDLAHLFETDLSSTIVAATFNRDLRHYHDGLEMSGKGFNAGLLLIDFNRWREHNVRGAIEIVMQKHSRIKLFRGGTQPILNVVFYQQCLALDRRWNFTGLGCSDGRNPKRLENAWILHWTGTYKPWKEDGLHKELWEKYRIAI